jgi:hypothetical protein
MMYHGLLCFRNIAMLTGDDLSHRGFISGTLVYLIAGYVKKYVDYAI